MAKKKEKKSATPLPSDWKRGVERRIEPDPALPNYIKERILLLLDKDDIAAAAELLWAEIPKVYETLELPDGQEIRFLTGILAHALYFLATMPEVDPALRYTQSTWANAAKRATSEGDRNLYWMIAEVAPKTRPSELGPRSALLGLREFFHNFFGRPMNKVVAYFMCATFGAGWDENLVRIRACRSQWGRYPDRLELDRTWKIVRAIQLFRFHERVEIMEKYKECKERRESKPDKP